VIVSKYVGGDDTKDGSFSYDSDKLYLYKDMDGNMAVLNTITYTLSGRQHHGSGQPCNCRIDINLTINLYLEDGTLLYSDSFNSISGGSTSKNGSINLFDYEVGENQYCYMQVRGRVSLKSENHDYMGGSNGVSYIGGTFDNAYVSYIPIDV